MNHMNSIKRMAVVLGLMGVPFAMLPACAGTMQDSKGAMMEKGETMAKDRSMTKTDKGMMGQKDGSMMKQKTGMMEGKMEAIRTGMLAGAGSHHAAGTASVTKDQSGHKTLKLTDIRVDRVPDGRVYLAQNGDYRTGIELGKADAIFRDSRFSDSRHGESGGVRQRGDLVQAVQRGNRSRFPGESNDGRGRCDDGQERDDDGSDEISGWRAS